MLHELIWPSLAACVTTPQPNAVPEAVNSAEAQLLTFAIAMQGTSTKKAGAVRKPMPSLTGVTCLLQCLASLHMSPVLPTLPKIIHDGTLRVKTWRFYSGLGKLLSAGSYCADDPCWSRHLMYLHYCRGWLATVGLRRNDSFHSACCNPPPLQVPGLLLIPFFATARHRHHRCSPAHAAACPE